MEQNTHRAPDSDLEAYGDWVTVDTAAPPAAAVRQPPAAAADVEIAAELTDAEEEFLGQLSDADHAAEAAAGAPGAGHPAANGNGAAESGRNVAGPSAGPGPAHAPAAPLAAAQPPIELRTEAVPAAVEPAPGAAAAVHAAVPAAPAPAPAVVPPPLPAVPVPYAAVPAHASAARPARRPPETPARLPATVAAPAPASSGAAGAQADPGADKIGADAEAAGGGALADLEKRIATLAAEVAEIAAEVARLQAAGGSDAPADPASSASDRVQVSLEELDIEQPPDTGTPVPAADAAREAGARDGEPAPLIRLVPIADEEDGQADHTTPGGEAEGADTGVRAASEPPHDSSPVPSHDQFRNDVRNVLGYLDQLLDDLPPERVREFAQSPQFATYKALFAQLGLDD